MSGPALPTNPLYPRKRTCALQLGMSALGQKRTSDKSFDPFVSDRNHFLRHFDTKRSRRLQVDDQLEFVRLEHRQLGGLRALEDATGVDAGLSPHVNNIGSVTHQSADVH